MSENLHYSKAPITEAVIDLRVEIPTEFGIEELQSVCRALENDYPVSKKFFSVSGKFEFQSAYSEDGDETATSRASAEHEHIGFRLQSEDKHYVFQARLDGFVLALLKPYSNWETFRDEARRLWNVYREIVPLNGITRAAVRYINRLDIPATTGIEISDYLKTYPKVSDAYPHSDINGFLVQLLIPQPDIPCTLLLRQASLESAAPDMLSVLLDIDLFIEHYDPMWKPEEDVQVWKMLEALRVRKNQVFQSSITEKLEKLIL